MLQRIYTTNKIVMNDCQLVVILMRLLGIYP